MHRRWVAAMLLGACASGAYAQVEPSPLMPHPPERMRQRPVYSQDRYSKEEAPEPIPDVKPPVYSQDKFGPSSEEVDNLDELRKVPDKGHEWSEVEIAKGVIQLNEDKLAEAEKHFNAALQKDPRNFVAMEYLSTIQERRDDPMGAIATLAKAKRVAPPGRWGVINFQIGRIYMLLKNLERSEVYLRLALDEGGHQTATEYMLGYLLYVEERFFEAERYLHDAKMRAQRRTALGPERAMLQAINYYLGEIYARLGFVKYSVLCLRGTEFGESWEVRSGAWRVHAELNRASLYLTMGLFAQYDTNVILLPATSSLPSEYSNAAGNASLFTINGGYQASPAKRWSWGVDGSFYLNNHLNKTLAEFDVLYLAGDTWLNYWNQRDWSFLLRYDYSNAMTNRLLFAPFQVTNGPAVSANYFPFQRWNWEFGYQARFNTYASDPLTGPERRSGATHSVFFRTGLKAPNPRLRPSLGYTYEADATVGENFVSRSHIFALEGDYRLFNKTHLIAGFTYTRQLFPNNLQSRDDSVRQTRLALNHLFDEHWLGLFDLTQTGDASTQRDYAYNRLVVTGGLTYTF